MEVSEAEAMMRRMHRWLVNHTQSIEEIATTILRKSSPSGWPLICRISKANRGNAALAIWALR